MQEIKQFICLVDVGGPIQFRHSTAGRYRVAAKNEKEAVKLLRAAIRFGSIRCIGTADSCDYDRKLPNIPYKFIAKYFYDEKFEPHWTIL